MKATLNKLWSALTTSFWFVPSVLVVMAMVLAESLVRLDFVLAGGWPELPNWLTANDAENARAMLATVAGSMVTVAGVTFSVTIVALSLASQQFGPRLLVRFMRDMGNQLVLGTFIATFVYCIVALRGIGAETGKALGEPLVPHLAIAGAVVLALSSMGVLIYFIHHVATSIQAGEVVAREGEQLTAAIDRTFADAPAAGDDAAQQEGESPEAGQAGATVVSPSTGYVAALDFGRLRALAEKEDLVVRMAVREGDFVVAGSPLAGVSTADGLDEEMAEEICDAFAFSRRRGMVGDLRLAFDRLVEVALRALSPGINDPFTAVACIDYLAAGLARLVETGPPVRRYLGKDGRVRVIACPPDLPLLVDHAFSQVRLYAGGDPVVLVRLLEAMSLLAARAREPAMREALRSHADRVLQQAVSEVTARPERGMVERQYSVVLELLGEAA